jgi:hypothetical protein
MKFEFKKVILTVRNKNNCTFVMYPKVEFVSKESVHAWFNANFTPDMSLVNIEFIEPKLYRVLYSKTVEGEILVNAANEKAAKEKAAAYLEYTGVRAYSILHAIEKKD